MFPWQEHSSSYLGAACGVPPSFFLTDSIGFFLVFYCPPLPSTVQNVCVSKPLSGSAEMSQVGKSGVRAMGSWWAGWLNQVRDWFRSGGAVEFVRAGVEK